MRQASKGGKVLKLLFFFPSLHPGMASSIDRLPPAISPLLFRFFLCPATNKTAQVLSSTPEGGNN